MSSSLNVADSRIPEILLPQWCPFGTQAILQMPHDPDRVGHLTMRGLGALINDHRPSLIRVLRLAGTEEVLDDLQNRIGNHLLTMLSNRQHWDVEAKSRLDDRISDHWSLLESAAEQVRQEMTEMGEPDPGYVEAAARAVVKMPEDRRRSSLSRVAFQRLRAGTTKAKLLRYLAEANNTFAQPLDSSDVASLADWCISEHLKAVVAARKQKNAA